jgi:hypothetical protein
MAETCGYETQPLDGNKGRTLATKFERSEERLAGVSHYRTVKSPSMLTQKGAEVSANHVFPVPHHSHRQPLGKPIHPLAIIHTLSYPCPI